MKDLIKKFLKFIKLFLSKVIPNKVFMNKEKNIFELYCEEEKIKCLNSINGYATSGYL